MQSLHTEGEGYDRSSLRLPGVQEVLALQVARMTDTPVIVVLIHGGPLDVQALQEAEGVDAILTAWFPGQVGSDQACLSSLGHLPLGEGGGCVGTGFLALLNRGFHSKEGGGGAAGR